MVVVRCPPDRSTEILGPHDHRTFWFGAGQQGPDGIPGLVRPPVRGFDFRDGRRRGRSSHKRRFHEAENPVDRTDRVLHAQRPMFPKHNPQETKNDPASESDRGNRMWQAYSFPMDLQSTASRLLFISCSPANPFKKNALMPDDNSVTHPGQISPHRTTSESQPSVAGWTGVIRGEPAEIIARAA